MPEVTVRPLREEDLPAADRIMRVAFGTYLGLPDPAAFMGDRSYVANRWRADPEAAFAAEVGGELVGSNFATNWGSAGFFGPLTVRPDLWDQGVAQRLMEPAMQCFERWGTTLAGLFTFAQSLKHVGLYRKHGFWPRFLTAVLSKPVEPPKPSSRWTRFSKAPAEQREAILEACTRLTGEIHPGLDLEREILAVAKLELGDTLLLWEGTRLAAFAVCQCGPGTEAGGGSCYLKFAAARPGPEAPQRFEDLLGVCEEMAAKIGLARLCAGVNTARHEAYRALLGRGFRTDLQGVSMHRPNDAGYDRPGVYVIDDWR